ncbi:MAG: hypothetical protein ACTSPO_16010 [Candidatus Heimdallarchaeaceae archaeon]
MSLNETERMDRMMAQERAKKRERQRNSPEGLQKRQVEALERIASSLEQLAFCVGEGTDEYSVFHIERRE